MINPFHVVSNGEVAISYFKGEGKFANRSQYPIPQLLILDLKIPRVDGFEVLRWLRQQPDLNAVGVLVLTSSQDMRDVNLAYQLGANSFLHKPVRTERFLN